MSRAAFPCPKCNRNLIAAGVMTVDGERLPTFSCDECLMSVDFGGEAMELPLTFVVGADGKPFDPASPDGRLNLDG